MSAGLDRPTQNRYQVLLVDPRGEAALQIARSLGGGGRATAPSGTVGGATVEAPEEVIHAITGHTEPPTVIRMKDKIAQARTAKMMTTQ